jgi:hypothetical protein
MVTSFSSIANSENITFPTQSWIVDFRTRVAAICVQTSGNDMTRAPNINQSNKLTAFLGLILTLNCQPAYADISSDEDELRYEEVIKPSFKRFHKKFNRFPRNWIELGIQDSCTGYSTNTRNHFPKATESVIWTPEDCQLSYKLVFSGKTSFRVVALAKGHVVSVYENFRATYYKTRYHSHEPPIAPEGTVY